MILFGLVGLIQDAGLIYHIVCILMRGSGHMGCSEFVVDRASWGSSVGVGAYWV